jgi:hypothetical protein
VNYWNTIGSAHKKPIMFDPIDETRRTRAIGVLAETVTTKPLEHFDPTQDLLIEADNKPVEPEAEYPYTVTKNLSKGFYLGINFGGKKEDSAANAPSLDPPQPFLRVDIESKGTREPFDKLEFVFQQKTTTEVVVKRIELHKEGGVEQKDNIQMLPGRDTEVQIGKLHIFLRPYLQIEDFRMTGRIHLAEPAIDSDRG